MGKHAFLSASSSHRWLECLLSAKLCSEQEDRASPYAQQGTDCHELYAYLVEKSLGRDVKDLTEDLTYYDQEMQDCAESYCSYVNEQIEEAKKHCSDLQVLIEQRLDFSRWVEWFWNRRLRDCGGRCASGHRLQCFKSFVIINAKDLLLSGYVASSKEIRNVLI